MFIITDNDLDGATVSFQDVSHEAQEGQKGD